MPSQPPRIRSVATTYTGSVIAVGEWEEQVYVWDLEARQKLSEFRTLLKDQALPLNYHVAISPNGDLCAAGAYEGKWGVADYSGLAMYNAKTGEKRWQRRDLKKNHHMVFSKHRPSLYVCVEDRPCHLLDVSTGETVNQLRDVDEIEESPFADIMLLGRHKGLDLMDMAGQKRLVRILRVTFGVLDIVFTETTVVVSEAGGPVSSYSLRDGKLTWKHTPPPENHVLHLGYAEQTSEVLGINWPYQHGGDYTLLAFKKDTGEIVRRFAVKGHVGDFALAGTRLITWAGEMIDTLTGEVASILEFPQ